MVVSVGGVVGCWLGVVAGVVAGARVLVGAGAAGARAGAGRVTIGLGAVTFTSGSCVCASATPLDTTIAASPVPPRRIRFQFMMPPEPPNAQSTWVRYVIVLHITWAVVHGGPERLPLKRRFARFLCKRPRGGCLGCTVRDHEQRRVASPHVVDDQ